MYTKRILPDRKSKDDLSPIPQGWGVFYNRRMPISILFKFILAGWALGFISHPPMVAVVMWTVYKGLNHGKR